MRVDSDDDIRALLTETNSIAMIGASDRPERDSHRVMHFLLQFGYTVWPVNPSLVGKTIHGRKVYASVADVVREQGPIDMVDIFRNSAAAAVAVGEAIAIGAKSVWMQRDVINPVAADRAEAAGLKVVMDRCPKIEIWRLGMLDD